VAEMEILIWLIALLMVGFAIGWLVARTTLQRRVIQLESQLEGEKNRNKERAADIEKTISALSSEALRQNNTAFLQLAEEKLKQFQATAKGDLELKEKAVEELVKPIRESLEKTGRQLEKLERDRAESHGELRRHLEMMAETQKTLQGETRNLVQALRRPEVRGRWGELTLRRLVELAGMVEHCDFVEQAHTEIEGGSLRPDMVVHMPGGRDVVVDVKTPLDSYLSAVEASDEATRKSHLANHTANVRKRINELAAKSYWQQFKDSPDFVVLFIPGDQFLAAALDDDHDLLEEALSKKVILATPTSLVALLRAIAYGWRQEALAENAEEIRKLGEELYSRLGTLAGHLSKLGKDIDHSVGSFNKLVGSLESRVLPAARRFPAMGIGDKETLSDTPQIESRTREIE